MSFLVAVMPAPSFRVKKPFFSSSWRARASLVVSLGTATWKLALLPVPPEQADRAAAAAVRPAACRNARREILFIAKLLFVSIVVPCFVCTDGKGRKKLPSPQV